MPQVIVTLQGAHKQERGRGGQSGGRDALRGLHDLGLAHARGLRVFGAHARRRHRARHLAARSS